MKHIEKKYNNDYIFSKETINNLKQKRINIIKDIDELENKIKRVLNKKERQLNSAIAVINDKTKEKIEKDINEKIFKKNQYTLIINDDSIIHTAEHFSDIKEIAKEIMRTIDIVEKYDRVLLVLEKGSKRLVFEKKYRDGNIRTVETTSKSNNSLNLVTTYFTKKQKPSLRRCYHDFKG